MEIAVALIIGVIVGGILVGFFASKNKQGMQDSFGVIAAEHLEKSRKSLIDTANDKFDEKIKDPLDNLSDKTIKLEERLHASVITVEKLDKEAVRLNSLLGNNQYRGKWAEGNLVEYLQELGLIQGIHYKVEDKDADGNKPDFTFILHKSRKEEVRVNLDCKFPFKDYESYLEGGYDLDPDKLQKKQTDDKKKFVKAVNDRVKEVTKYIDPPRTVDFALLYVPTEGMFRTICALHGSMIREAAKNNVVICSPITVFVIVQLIKQATKNFTIRNDLDDIVKAIEHLMNRVRLLKEDFDSMGDGLKEAHDNYKYIKEKRFNFIEIAYEAVEKLRSGSGATTENQSPVNTSHDNDDEAADDGGEE